MVDYMEALSSTFLSCKLELILVLEYQYLQNLTLNKDQLSGKGSAASTGDAFPIPGLGRSCGGGNGNPLQYSCLENPMDRGAWLATVRGVAKRWTRLSTITVTTVYAPEVMDVC